MINRLLYSQTYDDFDTIKAGLNLDSAGQFVTVCSSGDTPFNSVLCGVKRVYAIDYNPAQICLSMLKAGAMRNLCYSDFAALMGLRKGNRLRLYKSIRPSLSAKDKRYWDAHRNDINRGLLYCGLTEKRLRILRKIINITLGKKRVKKLIYCTDIKKQESYLEKLHKKKSWKAINWIIGKWFILPLGLSCRNERRVKINLQMFMNYNLSFLFTNARMHDNYFVSQILAGKYVSELPEYLKEKNFSKLKKNVDRIEFICSSLNNALANLGTGTIDAFYYTDAVEWLSQNRLDALFKLTAGCANKNAKMMHLECLGEANSQILKYDTGLSEKLFKKNKAAFYRSLKVYDLNN